MISHFETISPADSLRLSGRIYTPDAPIAVINLIHGFGEHCGRYISMMGALGDRGIATVALDLRGHGRSDGKRGVCHSYSHLHADVQALLQKTDDTFPDLPQILYGHSMGGGLVLDYILTHGYAPFHGIIASAPLIHLTQNVPNSVHFMVKHLRRLAPDITLRKPLSGTNISTLPEEQDAYESDPLNHGILGIGLGQDMIQAGKNILVRAKDWQAPLLLMHATSDRVTCFKASKAFAEKARNCTLLAIENAEHEIHNDQSRPDVYKAMTKFIQDLL